MIRKTIFSLSLLVSTGACSYISAYPELDSLPQIENYGKGLVISTAFVERKLRYIHAFTTSNIEYLSDKERIKKSNVRLARAIFSKKTLNPFKKIYPDIYKNFLIGKYNDCDFVGVKFELDNNKETHEWYIAFHGEVCTYRDKAIFAGSGHGSHAWILQRKRSGHYEVLMEANSSMDVAPSKQQGYKLISTNVNLKNIYRDEFYRTRYITSYKKNRPCGEGKIEWKYQQGRYTPFRLYPYKGCISYYEGVAEGQISSDIYVRDRLLEWLSQIMNKKMVLTKDNYLVSVD